jgi:anion-transporting  ArsA/GET3 family ATPase
MDKILRDHRVIVCTGSGGVGKTTLAAALGLRAARCGLKVLVLTIDPARRLATSLGMGDAHGEVRVSIPDAEGELHAEMIEPARIFEDFIRRLAPSEEVVSSILSNGFYRQLSTTLSGSQEFTSLVRLYESASSQNYDLIVLDTPPAEHAIDFLHAPEKLTAMFQGSVVRWFVGKPEEMSLITRLMHRSTRTLLSTMEVLTGAGFMRELSSFFDSLRTLADDIAETSRRAHELLLSRETAFVLMTSLDQAKLQEGEEFCAELNTSGYRLQAVIVNRAYPRWFLEDKDQMTQSMESIASPELIDLYRDMSAFFEQRCAFYDDFRAPDGESVTVVKIPELDEDVYGLDALGRVGGYLDETATPAGGSEGGGVARD